MTSSGRLDSYCRECRREYAKARRAAGYVPTRKLGPRFELGSPEYVERKRRQAHEHYLRHRDRIIERTGDYQRQNRQKVAAAKAAWYRRRQAADVGPGFCDECGHWAARRSMVQSRSWIGAVCADDIAGYRSAGIEFELTAPDAVQGEPRRAV
jgi:hypothetical protein